MHRRLCRVSLATTLAAIAITVSACAEPEPATTSPSGAPPAPTAPAPVEQNADSTGGTVTTKFGGKFDGEAMGIALSKPASFSPSDSALVQNDTGRAVAFTIEVTNKRSNSLPAMTLQTEATSGNQQCEAIQDSAQQVGTSMSNILPGKSLQWKIAFAVPKTAKNLTVQVSSMAGGKTIVFEGPLT